jgi:hypothetical protein
MDGYQRTAQARRLRHMAAQAEAETREKLIALAQSMR